MSAIAGIEPPVSRRGLGRRPGQDAKNVKSLIETTTSTTGGGITGKEVFELEVVKSSGEEPGRILLLRFHNSIKHFPDLGEDIVKSVWLLDEHVGACFIHLRLRIGVKVPARHEDGGVG